MANVNVPQNNRRDRLRRRRRELNRIVAKLEASPAPEAASSPIVKRMIHKMRRELEGAR